MSSLFLDTLNQNPSSQTPIWFMRQAGRYLPEYREIRKKFPQFLEFCYTPEAACEVTLQPISRFGFDAAIMFSDILVIPHALGQKVWFEAGEGPKLEALTDQESVDALKVEKVEGHLAPVFEAIKLIRRSLPEHTPLIGFAGSPWTLACYMMEGQGSREYEKARRCAYQHTEMFQVIIDRLVQAIILYATRQIESGIQAFQLFDSWSGVLPDDQFQRWVIEPTKAITSSLKQSYPHIPIIGFARGAGAKLATYAEHSGVDAIGIDTAMPLADVAQHHAKGKVIQGNLDPLLLASNKQGAIAQTKKILQLCKNTPHIFNLGHGIVPDTPIEHVEAVIETVRSFRA